MSKIISTNFIKPTPFIPEKLQLYVGISIVVMFVLLMYLLIRSSQVEQQLNQLESNNETLSEQYDQISRSEVALPDQSVMQELDRKVALVNNLGGIVGESTVTVLNEIEKSLPNNALITTLSHKAKLGEVDLTVKSTDTLSLTAFVHDLESSEHFNQVLIRRQSHDEQDSDATAYDIRIIQAHGK